MGTVLRKSEREREGTCAAGAEKPSDQKSLSHLQPQQYGMYTRSHTHVHVVMQQQITTQEPERRERDQVDRRRGRWMQKLLGKKEGCKQASGATRRRTADRIFLSLSLRLRSFVIRISFSFAPSPLLSLSFLPHLLPLSHTS